MDPATPLGYSLTIDGCDFVVARLGTPVCSKTATAAYLRSAGFSAQQLTCLVGADDRIAHVVWCTQAANQKLVTPALMAALLGDAPPDDSATPPTETVQLADGRVITLPIAPRLQVRGRSPLGPP
jgi:hypothetical protein